MSFVEKRAMSKMTCDQSSLQSLDPGSKPFFPYPVQSKNLNIQVSDANSDQQEF